MYKAKFEWVFNILICLIASHVSMCCVLIEAERFDQDF